MTNPHLQQMHGTMLEVQLEVQGSLRFVCGKGSFDNNDPDIGPALRILISDPCGDFELILPKSTWVGSLETSERPGCDFRITFANSPMSSRN